MTVSIGDKKAEFSNWVVSGICCAPGTNIYSTYWNAGYTFDDGIQSSHGKERAYKIADEPRVLTYFSDPNGNKELPLNYRQHDEYLEWVVRRDNAKGKIKEIIFTCEGPEYWLNLSNDQKLLLKLYKNSKPRSNIV